MSYNKVATILLLLMTIKGVILIHLDFQVNILRHPVPNSQLSGTLIRPKRIVNGEKADRRTTSYYAQVIRVVEVDVSYKICGGVVISEYYVLTAAHCLIRKDPNITVILNGLWYENEGGDINQTPTILTTHETIQHEDFDPLTLLHDIGLVKLPSNGAQLTGSFKKMDLPLQGYDYDLVSGQICGLGHHSKGQRSDLEQHIMRCTQVLVSHMECLGYGIGIAPSQMCIRAPRGIWGGIDFGDSGGGFIVDGNVVGIISGHIKEYAPYGPSIYTRVPFYIKWILAKIVTK